MFENTCTFIVIFVSSDCKECRLLGVFNRKFWQHVDRLAGNVNDFKMCLALTHTHYNSCCIYFTVFFLYFRDLIVNCH